jgi:hypothetical protein
LGAGLKIEDYRLISSTSPTIRGGRDNPRLFCEVGHSFLRKRGPDDIGGQVFHGLFFPGQDAGTTEDLKSGMLPGFNKINMKYDLF